MINVREHFCKQTWLPLCSRLISGPVQTPLHASIYINQSSEQFYPIFLIQRKQNVYAGNQKASCILLFKGSFYRGTTKICQLNILFENDTMIMYLGVPVHQGFETVARKSVIQKRENRLCLLLLLEYSHVLQRHTRMFRT